MFRRILIFTWQFYIAYILFYLFLGMHIFRSVTFWMYDSCWFNFFQLVHFPLSWYRCSETDTFALKPVITHLCSQFFIENKSIFFSSILYFFSQNVHSNLSGQKPNIKKKPKHLSTNATCHRSGAIPNQTMLFNSSCNF